MDDCKSHALYDNATPIINWVRGQSLWDVFGDLRVCMLNNGQV